MIMRIRYEKLGGHYHCCLFTARAQGQTFAKCGDLVFDEQEWPEVTKMLTNASIQVLEYGERP